ncbi:hypothetical protein [Streptomyces halstedii]|uniref:hypothetical protein n=1 Tax=Streptomyces halstedii TaxID=1944 RepID=UPI00335E3CBD
MQQTLQDWRKLREQQDQEASRLAAELTTTATVTDLDEVERELLAEAERVAARLAEVRERRTRRAGMDLAYRVARDLSSRIATVEEEARELLKPLPVAELGGFGGLGPVRPNADDRVAATGGPGETLPDSAAGLDALARISRPADTGPYASFTGPTAVPAPHRTDGTYLPPEPDGTPVNLSALARVREGLEQLDGAAAQDGADRG